MNLNYIHTPEKPETLSETLGNPKFKP
jgi:hypothetical protein